MRGVRSRLGFVVLGVAVVLALGLAAPAAAKVGPGGATYPYVTPVFGMATANDGSLLVADAGSGIVELRKGVGKLVASLPAVTDIAPSGRGSMFAVTGAIGEGVCGPGCMLYFVSRGTVLPIADLHAFEVDMNPDGGEIDSNPFDVAALSEDTALVADAAGNDLLIVDKEGNVDWVATFPDELVSTANAKALVGCDDTPPEELEFVCDLPESIPAQAVPTSVVIGPDSAYYVSELKGFPGPLEESRIWRIEAGTLHADCETSEACTVVADGFTSIVDLSFGPDGTLYVTEIDEASFLAVELVGFFGYPPEILLGGTVNACDVSWTCNGVVTGLPIPIATAVAGDGVLYVAILALIPGAATVIPLS